ncbi:hypothetical protein [Larkinella sp. C7]|uniref:hypothetical protein n=1 Tax=Larkinella sp. C7 TaxID=2576607 RepID=UPI0011115D4F|nr:hypothetical protein [Larkinella sp. C7]
MTNETAQNNSGTDKKSLVEQYARPRYGAPIKPRQAEQEINNDTDQPEDGSYRALIKYRGRKSSSRFCIITRQGVSYGCGYAYMLGWLFTPPDTLSIQTTTHLFTIGGTGLHLIESALLREVVMELREFNPGQDAAPPEGEPVITHLDVLNRFKEA